MDILLTNDDGILAPGLLALYDAAGRFGTVHIVAPETPQSATGHSITLTSPLMCNTVQLREDIHGHSVDGRPADCVKLAIVELLPRRPNLVLSGINAGSNAGINILYSGTVAAAVEAALFGIPAVALSVVFHEKVDFAMARDVAAWVLQTLIENNTAAPAVVYNVNIPSLTPGWPKGIKVVKHSTQPMEDAFQKRTDPRGRLYFWMSPELNIEMHEQQTDVQALRDGYVAVTPLKFDLTDDSTVQQMQQWQWPKH